MLAKSFILALFTLSASASLDGHHHHLGHHHQASLHLARRAGNGPPLVARSFGSRNTTATVKPHRRQLRRPLKKARFCSPPTSSSTLSATTSTAASTEAPRPTSSTSTSSPPSNTESSEAPRPTSSPDTKPIDPVPAPSKPPSGGDMHTGEATYYGTGLGACGIESKDTDYIVAVSMLLFDSFPGYAGGNPNNNPICNKMIHVEYGGKSIQVRAVDRCVGCAFYDLDFSPTAFQALFDVAKGRVPDMKWIMME